MRHSGVSCDDYIDLAFVRFSCFFVKTPSICHLELHIMFPIQGFLAENKTNAFKRRESVGWGNAELKLIPA